MRTDTSNTHAHERGKKERRRMNGPGSHQHRGLGMRGRYRAVAANGIVPGPHTRASPTSLHPRRRTAPSATAAAAHPATTIASQQFAANEEHSYRLYPISHHDITMGILTKQACANARIRAHILVSCRSGCHAYPTRRGYPRIPVPRLLAREKYLDNRHEGFSFFTRTGRLPKSLAAMKYSRMGTRMIGLFARLDDIFVNLSFSASSMDFDTYRLVKRRYV